MKVLVDTNVLLRRIDRASTQHQAALDAVPRLIERGDELFLVPQVLAEFWFVATRPVGERHNGLGLSFAAVNAEHERLRQLFLLQRDEPAIFDVWEEFVLEHRVTRGRIHDARLVAALRVHGFDRLLTFDNRDFARWGVPILDPAAV